MAVLANPNLYVNYQKTNNHYLFQVLDDWTSHLGTLINKVVDIDLYDDNIHHMSNEELLNITCKTWSSIENSQKAAIFNDHPRCNIGGMPS